MRVIRATILPTCLIVFCTPQSRAQISGAVVDSSGAAISRTAIRVIDAATRQTVKTLRPTADGRFDVLDLPPGHYLISFSSTGFSPELLNVDTTLPGAGAFRTVRMHILDCDAPKIDCEPMYFPNPPPDPHPIIAQASVAVDVASAVDLDKAALVTLTASTADFSIDREDGGIYLNSLNGAVLLTKCKPEYGRRRPKNLPPPFRLDGLDPYTEICMTTKRGRFSEVFLVDEVKPGDQRVSLYVVTRDR